MFRKLLGISIVVIALASLVLGVRRIRSNGGVLGTANTTDDIEVAVDETNDQEGKTPIILDDSIPSLSGDTVIGSESGTHGAASLVISMPGWMYTQEWQLFFERFEQAHGVTIDFKHAGSLSDHRDASVNQFEEVDIALIPHVWFYELQPQLARVQLPAVFYGGFGSEWQPLLLDTEATFFPYFLDMPVLFSTQVLEDTSWKGLLQRVLLGESSKQFPLVWGRDSITEQLRSKGGEIYPGHRQIRELFSFHFRSYASLDIRHGLIELAQKNTAWDTLRLRVRSTSQEDPYCVDHLVGCLFSKGETDHAISFPSSYSAWQRYYPEYEWNNLSLSALELGNGPYPSAARGRVIRDSSAHTELSLLLLQEYLSSGQEMRYDFRDYPLLSPFTSWESLQKRFLLTMGFDQRRFVITDPQDSNYQSLAQDTSFFELLEGNFDPQLYLQ